MLSAAIGWGNHIIQALKVEYIYPVSVLCPNLLHLSPWVASRLSPSVVGLLLQLTLHLPQLMQLSLRVAQLLPYLQQLCPALLQLPLPLLQPPLQLTAVRSAGWEVMRHRMGGKQFTHIDISQGWLALSHWVPSAFFSALLCAVSTSELRSLSTLRSNDSYLAW